MADPAEDCWAEHDADVLLARLAVVTFARYGRLDPWLLVPSADGTKLSAAASAKPIEAQSQWADLFVKTGLDVARNPIARRAFLAGTAAAKAACGKDGCPSLAKSHKVTLKEHIPDGDEVNYHFRIEEGPIPSLFEWENGVMRQFSHVPPHCDYFRAALVIPDPEPVDIVEDEVNAEGAAMKTSESDAAKKPNGTGVAYGEVLPRSGAEDSRCCSQRPGAPVKKKVFVGDPPQPRCRTECPD